MEVDRRSFLRAAGVLGASAFAAPSLLAACTRGRSVVVPSPFDDAVDDISPDARAGLQVFLGAGDLVAGRTQRVPLGLVDPEGATLDADTARLWIAPTRGRGDVVGPVRLEPRKYARARPEDPQGFYVAMVALPTTRFSTVLVEARRGAAAYIGTSVVEILERPRDPDVGTEAIAFPTPTESNPAGVATLCTRQVPCDLHRVSLDDALGKTPVVFIVGSPKLCTSRTCGPVLEEVLLVEERRRGAAAFIHAEPYARDDIGELSPVMKRWDLQSEPWVFVIDGSGIIRARFEGPVVADEIERELVNVV